MTMTEQVSRLELLHRVCRRKGWALLLRSTGDGDRREHSSRVTVLDVVEPLEPADPDDPRVTRRRNDPRCGNRRRRIMAGDLIARALLPGPERLDEAAEQMLATMYAYGLIDSLREDGA